MCYEIGLVAFLVSTLGRTTLQFNIAESFDPADEVNLKCSETAPIVIFLKGVAVKVKTSVSPSAPDASTPTVNSDS